MKRLLTIVLIAASLPLVGCGGEKDEKKKVDINAPGVDVKSNENGTQVKTPGADVDVKTK
jgi:hypothetical protein